LYFFAILQNLQKSGLVSQILYPRTEAIEIQSFNINSYIELRLLLPAAVIYNLCSIQKISLKQ